MPPASPPASRPRREVYDRIEIPPIKPDVTRVRLFGGQCTCCGQRVTAEAPPGLEPGSPFGQSVCALVVYLHYAHAIGFERLAALLGEVFGLRISEGAISNMLQRASKPLLAAQSAIQTAVTAAPVVCCDETSARVCGRNWWEWVFVTSLAVLHVIRPSRGRAVVAGVFGDTQPAVWVSDMFGAQRGHGLLWQVCLAHLLRDAQFAIESGDDAFSAPFKLLLLRAVAIGRRRERLADTTLARYAADLDRRLDRIVAAVPVSADGVKLRKRILANRGACSCSSLIAMCPPRTTSLNATSAPASSSAKSPTASAANGAQTPTPPSAPWSAPLKQRTWPCWEQSETLWR